MATILPAEKPKITKEELLKLIKAAHPSFTLPDFAVVGIRGYFQDSMGEKGTNDRKIYDDAIFLVGKNGYAAFNANTDPSAFKMGIASLKPGIYPVYQFDKHKGQTAEPYMAICQRGGDVTVIRDGKGEDKGSFGINIHRGGNFKTSSLGCQTIPPQQFDSEFMPTAHQLAKEAFGPDYLKKKDLVYILLENKPAEKKTAPVAVAQQ